MDKEDAPERPAEEKKSSRPRRQMAADEEKTQVAAAKEEAPDATISGKPRRKRGDTSNAPGGGSGGGGWMSTVVKEEATESVTTMEQARASPEKPVRPTAVSNKNKHDSDSDNEDIIVIPDLDEEGGADADHKVAHAPRNITRRIPTLSELESETVSPIATAEIEGLDLSCLQSTLVPLELIRESDTVWTFESLLTEATDEINQTPPPKPKVKKTITPLSPVGKGKVKIGNKMKKANR
jgi:hypothetical protein